MCADVGVHIGVGGTPVKPHIPMVMGYETYECLCAGVRAERAAQREEEKMVRKAGSVWGRGSSWLPRNDWAAVR